MADRDAERAVVTQPQPKSKKRGRQGEYSGPVCGAATRNPARHGRPCQRPAGWGTDHVGYGLCKLHGGSTRAHTLKAIKDEMRDRMQDEMEVPLLVRQIDRDTIRRVALAVVDQLDLSVDQQARARELIHSEIQALSAPVKGKTARRIAARERAKRAEASSDHSALEPTAEELDALERIERPTLVRRRKRTTNPNPQENK